MIIKEDKDVLSGYAAQSYYNKIQMVYMQKRNDAN
jgi:hypothetical protein